MVNPIVPDVPGVPPLVRSGPAPAPPVLLQGDTISTVGQTTSPHWGLFLNGEQVVFADSVNAFEFKQDWDLLDYPIEDGAFETYNKVKIPFEIHIRFATGGSESNRTALLDTIDRISETLDLYDAVTPEATYTNCNIEHYDYKRTNDNGAGLILVDVHLRQVRVTETPQFSNTSTPSGADPLNEGGVQAQPANTTQTTKVYNLFNSQQAPVLSGSPVNTFPTNQITLFPSNGSGF